MELEKIYQAIITGRAMLITGSGAHITALGMNGEKFPSGVALAERLYEWKLLFQEWSQQVTTS